MTDWKSIYIKTKEYPFSEQLRANKYLKEGLDFQISEDGEVYFSGKALLTEVACLRHFAIEESEKVKELKKLNKSLLRKLKGVRKRRKADIRHYEIVLRYSDKELNDYALRETALIEENERFRKALENIKNELEMYQNKVYDFHFDIDSKSAAYMLSIANNALEGKDD